MLKTLALRGFRGFESYELTDLATVNLIVGKNNCGKTTILEAVELLVSNGHPFALYDVAGRRGEVASSGNNVQISHLLFRPRLRTRCLFHTVCRRRRACVVRTHIVAR